jgi:hypothetical protein
VVDVLSHLLSALASLHDDVVGVNLFSALAEHAIELVWRETLIEGEYDLAQVVDIVSGILEL